MYDKLYNIIKRNTVPCLVQRALCQSTTLLCHTIFLTFNMTSLFIILNESSSLLPAETRETS